MKKQETLDTLIDSIAKGVYVKSFRIDLLGTVDDTSHKIMLLKIPKCLIEMYMIF